MNQLDEPKIMCEFRRHAGGYATIPIPGDDDHLGWLVLMQHHRLPTRLLDWSQSILVALFFAVSDSLDPAPDGELWVLDPESCNELNDLRTDLSGHVDPLDQARKSMAEEAFKGPTSAYCTYPLAFRPTVSFERMRAQLSAFTIHPTPYNGEPGKLTDYSNVVHRYTIPSAQKRLILADLHCLGVTDRSLFPDLEGLSRTVVYERREYKDKVVSPHWPCVCEHCSIDLPAGGNSI